MENKDKTDALMNCAFIILILIFLSGVLFAKVMKQSEIIHKQTALIQLYQIQAGEFHNDSK